MNISNRQMALRTGLHAAHVSRLRNGQRAPSVDVIWLLHKTLDLDIYQMVEAAAMGRASFGKFLDLKTRQAGEPLETPPKPPPKKTMIELNTILATPEEWAEVVALARAEEDEWDTLDFTKLRRGEPIPAKITLEELEREGKGPERKFTVKPGPRPEARLLRNR